MNQEKRPSYYAIIPSSVRYDERLKFAERLLYGEITALFGTHTHVQTADETILPKGTGYITDIGMTGPKHSVIGMEISASIKRFETTLPERYKIADGACMFNAIIIDIDNNTNKAKEIIRIRK